MDLILSRITFVLILPLAKDQVIYAAKFSRQHPRLAFIIFITGKMKEKGRGHVGWLMRELKDLACGEEVKLRAQRYEREKRT